MQFFSLQIKEDNDILARKDFSTNKELVVGLKQYAAERMIFLISRPYNSSYGSNVNIILT